jgi:hypothetical protein
MLLDLVFLVALLVGLWKTFEKLGKPGWVGIVPIYNLYVLFPILGRPAWWAFLALVPLVQIVVVVIAGIELARAFGKSEGYGVGLAILGFVFFPMLGFGPDKFQGPRPLNLPV